MRRLDASRVINDEGCGSNLSIHQVRKIYVFESFDQSLSVMSVCVCYVDFRFH